ncbi:MAG: 16S rRNA (cytidine(1402)-2'-O)-methyltransferase [Patescibacteria group bacterium]|nr:16S rRNA (cytidine(1402)-2'-O)-methyltransferase [Patescibacteria group bacterium]
MGILYLVATPIGNLEDVTFRGLKVLKSSDLVVCEDTRVTGKLLSHYEISKPLESFFEHNELSKTAKIVSQILSGANVALVTDAGMPAVSDPGYSLVRAAIAQGVKVVPIPGPSAAVAALAASGLPTDRFVFVGFLPQKPGKRRNFLESLKLEEGTIVVYESPHRLLFTLKDILEVLGNRQICVARELTKIHEDFVRGAVSEVLEKFKGRQVKGEVTLIIAGK